MNHFIKVLSVLLAMILMIMAMPVFGETYAWNCPGCGRTGNTGNYCGGCGHPAPWKEELSASDENPFTIYIIEDTYVRTRPSTDNSTSKMLIRAEAGESFTAYARVPSENGGKDYYQIIYNGQYAYITTSKSSIEDHGDTEEDKSILYNKAQEYENSMEYEKAKDIYLSLQGYKDSEEKASESQRYLDYYAAKNFLSGGSYKEAYDIFSALDDFLDSKAMAKEAYQAKQYEAAVQYEKDGNYSQAEKIYMTLGSYKDSSSKRSEMLNLMDYQRALDYYNKGDYDKAYVLFSKLAGINDSDKFVNEIENNIFIPHALKTIDNIENYKKTHKTYTLEELKSITKKNSDLLSYGYLIYDKCTTIMFEKNESFNDIFITYYDGDFNSNGQYVYQESYSIYSSKIDRSSPSYHPNGVKDDHYFEIVSARGNKYFCGRGYDGDYNFYLKQFINDYTVQRIYCPSYSTVYSKQ